MPARGTWLVPSPANGLDVRAFPEFVLPVGATLYRVHRSGVVVWWFNRDGSRRFDLKGGNGTCYTAATDEGAFIEVFGRTGIIDPADVATRSLAIIRIDSALRLADLRAASAAGFGVTATLSAGVPYEQHSHPWARALWQAGFDGIRYVLRHDPTGDESGYALFGPGGSSLGYGAAPTGPIDHDLLVRCVNRWGLTLAP